MTNGENKIPTVELSENKGSRNSKGDAKENESRTGIFASLANVPSDKDIRA